MASLPQGGKEPSDLAEVVALCTIDRKAPMARPPSDREAEVARIPIAIEEAWSGRNGRRAMRTFKHFQLSTVAAMALAAMVAWPMGARAQGPAVSVGATDLGGAVTGANGPEA